MCQDTATHRVSGAEVGGAPPPPTPLPRAREREICVEREKGRERERDGREGERVKTRGVPRVGRGGRWRTAPPRTLPPAAPFPRGLAPQTRTAT